MRSLSSLLLALCLGSLHLPAAVHAQMSPNCERNGRRDHCALTAGTASTPAGQQPVDLIVFADHTVYEVWRDQRSCRTAGAITTCNASIQVRGGRSLPAVYRGTAYEGGYRNEYRARGLRFSYGILD